MANEMVDEANGDGAVPKACEMCPEPGAIPCRKRCTDQVLVELKASNREADSLTTSGPSIPMQRDQLIKGGQGVDCLGSYVKVRRVHPSPIKSHASSDLCTSVGGKMSEVILARLSNRTQVCVGSFTLVPLQTAGLPMMPEPVNLRVGRAYERKPVHGNRRRDGGEVS